MEFRGLKAQYQKYRSEIDESIHNVLQKGHFIGGSEVQELEEQLSKYQGVKHCITCANGTEAMSLVLMAWGIKEGDAVFVPDFTFFSTAEVVALIGATPIFVDVDQGTFNMDPVKLEKSITKVIQEGKLTPKVIIPVDLFGLPANYIEIKKIAKHHNLLILEDSAQGFGGKIGDKNAGSFGDAGTVSFFPAKPLGAYGDGGAIFTSDDRLAETITSLKMHGKGKNKYDNIRIGFNSRLDTIQAAVLLVKYRAFVEHELEDINKVAKMYDDELASIVKVPKIPQGYYSSFAQYTIKLKHTTDRDGLHNHLLNMGIPSFVYYHKPMHKQTAFSYLKYNDDNFTITNELCNTVLSLPIHPYLTEKEISTVVDNVKSYFNN
ncbi:DegT/DnrJ/EryC1/StrS family aminotransferase [Gracilibacillus massiliensis]|uniref:DegT/DnrJ/EryC1/StrS family aminotransferase n=1 Tax=Gracilibacillus massiliensis TaxID=1564956 RepID=UPI00071D5441|nr:DegT/DnrJ/EryC1/StrS family aminotransferase [Gracilibacillus massiliensis]